MSNFVQFELLTGGKDVSCSAQALWWSAVLNVKYAEALLSGQMQVSMYANKACDGGYPETCYLWAGFLAKLAVHYDRMAGDVADVGILNRVSVQMTCGTYMH